MTPYAAIVGWCAHIFSGWAPAPTMQTKAEAAAGHLAGGSGTAGPRKILDVLRAHVARTKPIFSVCKRKDLDEKRRTSATNERK